MRYASSLRRVSSKNRGRACLQLLRDQFANAGLLHFAVRSFGEFINRDVAGGLLVLRQSAFRMSDH